MNVGDVLTPMNRELPPAATPDAAGFDDRLRALGREDAENAVRQLVSSALLQPALAALRDSPYREGPFAAGDAERRFGPMLDQHIADRVLESANFRLVDDIVDKYLNPGTSSPSETWDTQGDIALEERVDVRA